MLVSPAGHDAAAGPPVDFDLEPAHCIVTLLLLEGGFVADAGVFGEGKRLRFDEVEVASAIALPKKVARLAIGSERLGSCGEKNVHPEGQAVRNGAREAGIGDVVHVAAQPVIAKAVAEEHGIDDTVGGVEIDDGGDRSMLGEQVEIGQEHPGEGPLLCDDRGRAEVVIAHDVRGPRSDGRAIGAVGFLALPVGCESVGVEQVVEPRTLAGEVDIEADLKPIAFLGNENPFANFGFGSVGEEFDDPSPVGLDPLALGEPERGRFGKESRRAGRERAEPSAGPPNRNFGVGRRHENEAHRAGFVPRVQFLEHLAALKNRPHSHVLAKGLRQGLRVPDRCHHQALEHHPILRRKPVGEEGLEPRCSDTLLHRKAQ